MHRISLFILTGFILLAPMFVSAQIPSQLVPCGSVNEEGIIDDPCQACHAVQLGQNIIEFLIGIAAFLAVLLFAYAGFLMLTSAGNTGKVEQAKGIFSNVLIGFIIVLMGWLIVDTVMKYAFEGSALDGETSSTFGPWNQINCVDQPVIIREGSGEGAVSLPPDVRASGAYSAYDAEYRSRLESEGVSFSSSGGCADPTRTNCTSLAGMQPATVEQISIINQACSGCGVTVTGGTEAGHAGGAESHGAGYKVDIDDGNVALNSFLESTLTPTGRREGAHGGDRYKDDCGNEYVKEDSHWDITVVQACPL